MTLKRAIRRLRLKPGDILIVRDQYLLEPLMKMGQIAKINFDVPIIFEKNKGDVRRQNGGR